MVEIPLCLEGLIVARAEDDRAALFDMTREVLERQIILSGNYLTGNLNFDELSSVGQIHSYHYLPEERYAHDGASVGGGAFVCGVSSIGAGPDYMEPSRRFLQETFLLPTDRPVFRPENAYAFSEDVAKSPYLRNVHLGLKHPLPNAENPSIGIVQGNYIYHHYLQVTLTFSLISFLPSFSSPKPFLA